MCKELYDGKLVTAKYISAPYDYIFLHRFQVV